MARGWAAVVAGCAALLTGGAPQAADLEFFTGQDLYAACSQAPAADLQTRQALCAGYVVGVSDSQQAAQGAGGANRICLRAGASATKMTDQVRAYLEAHPEKRPLAAKDLVIEALAAAYPCA